MSNRSDEQLSTGLEQDSVGVVGAGRVAVISAAMPPAAQVAELADVFGLLADPGRLRVLVALLDGETCVSDLAAVALASESAVSHHLRLLRAHRVVEVRRSGRMAYYRLADTPWPFEDLDQWLRRRLRQVRWKEWKRPRTRRRNLATP